MKITAKRQQYLNDLVLGDWVHRFDKSADDDEKLFDAELKKWDKETDRFFLTVTNPMELHFFAENQDIDGFEVTLQQIATHPKCDAGTALLVYWQNAPEWKFQYKFDGDTSHDTGKTLAMLVAIEKRYLSGGFKAAKIFFDPLVRHVGRYRECQHKWTRSIPWQMYFPSTQYRQLVQITNGKPQKQSR